MNTIPTYEHIAPWERIFPEASCRLIPKDVDVFGLGDSSDYVYLVERGAIVEIRSHDPYTTHAVGLYGPGTLLGGRLTSTPVVHTTRATALVNSAVRSLERGEFLHALLRDHELADAFMKELTRRLETAQKLSETCQAATSGEHILGVLHTLATTFGTNALGHSTIALDESILERMTGMPHHLLVATVEELRSHNLVLLENVGIT